METVGQDCVGINMVGLQPCVRHSLQSTRPYLESVALSRETPVDDQQRYDEAFKRANSLGERMVKLEGALARMSPDNPARPTVHADYKAASQVFEAARDEVAELHRKLK